MTHLLSATLMLVFLGGACLAQGAGEVIVETGGETHVFPLYEGWFEPVHGRDPARRVEIWAAHPDSSLLRLHFIETEGRPSEVGLVFLEPGGPGSAAQEWSAGPGFRLQLSEVVLQDGALMLDGSYGGALVDTADPGLRGTISGTFRVTLEQPIAPPG